MRTLERICVICASAKGSSPMVREVIKHKNLDANATEDDGDAQLMAACRVGNLEVVVELLKDDRANVNSKDTTGFTALWQAIYRERRRIIVELLNYKKLDVNLRDEGGITVLTVVAVTFDKKDTGVVEFLKRERVDVNAKMIQITLPWWWPLFFMTETILLWSY